MHHPYSFFCSIGAMGLQNYKDKVNHLTEAQLLEDLEEQIHANSKICSKRQNGITKVSSYWYQRLYYGLSV